MEKEEYLEREVTAEFSFGCSHQVTSKVSGKFQQGCLANAVEEASATFMAACRQLKVPVDPEGTYECHLTLRYWHLEDTKEMVMVDIQCSACELPSPGGVAEAVEKLVTRVVPRFVDMLYNQKIILPA